MLNDMFILAPETLIDRNILWEELDPLTIRATWANAGHDEGDPRRTQCGRPRDLNGRAAFHEYYLSIFKVPASFRIFSNHAPTLCGSLASGENFAEIVDLGVRLVINMDWIPPDPKLNRAPLRLLTLATRDSPLTPMPTDKIWTGVRAATATIGEGDKVMVYCKGGVHRSAVMACCILISQGYTAEKAIRLVKEKRPAARPDHKHHKKVIEGFEAAWRAK